MYDNLPSYLDHKYDPFCGSLPDIVAVIAGIKPLTRLSFSGKGDAYNRFIKFIGKYDVFLADSQYRASVDSEGKKKTSNGRLKHVYLSKSGEILDFYRFGDPDLRLDENNRPPEKSMAALREFSNDLGYPSCCVGSQLENGRRKKIYSYSRSAQGNKAPFYLNNFLHSISNYYLSFHSPCSLGCKKTKAYNKQIFDAIRKLEPEFAERMRQVLTMPLIAWFNRSGFPFDDRIIVLFDGSLIGDIITYSKCFILRSSYPNNKKFSKKNIEELIYLKKGNKVKNTKHEIYIYAGSKLVRVIEKKSEFDGLLFDFYG